MSNPTPTYVLVHGAFQDASVWAHTAEALQARGHTAVAVTLPGRHPDTTPPGDVTLEMHRDAVLDAVRTVDGPVTLVGHSFGGIVIAEVAEAEPDRIDGLVFVGAYLPRNGDTMAALSREDNDNAIDGTNFLMADDYSYAYIPDDQLASIFANDGDTAQRAQVSAARRNEPLRPLDESSTVTDSRFGRVTKRYIATKRDLVVSPQLQRLMLSRTPVATVDEIDTGHSPFVTAPTALVALLVEDTAS